MYRYWHVIIFSRNANSPIKCTVRSKYEKASVKQDSSENEVYRIMQALLLVFSVLLLSYHGLRHGRTEYTLLDNGETMSGYVLAHKAVVTLSIGYSIPYSIVSSLAALMLLYSLVSKEPRWSLPLIVLYLADLVCDVSDAIVATWLFFGNLNFQLALFYTIGTLLLILTEVWVWLGVLRLYEYRISK